MLNHMEREKLAAPPIKRRQQCEADGDKPSSKRRSTQHGLPMTASSARPKPSQANTIA